MPVFRFNNFALWTELQCDTKENCQCISFRLDMQCGQFDFRDGLLQNKMVLYCIMEFHTLDSYCCFVSCKSVAVYVSKPKQGKITEKRQKSRKTAFSAFFRAKGKLAKIHAILRKQESHIRRFVSVNKASKIASRGKTI